jgi:hypothetical protein
MSGDDSYQDPAEVPEPMRDGMPSSAQMAPGDEAPAGTKGTGEDICPECSGSGRANGGQCSDCAGTGKVIKGISGA